MRGDLLYLGVDGGGTTCRARLADAHGHTLGEGRVGPANIRLGAKNSMSSVLEAAAQCAAAAGLSDALSRTVACLALAGASEPEDFEPISRLPHPFRHIVFVSDAQAACAGAHLGGDGGVIILGTGAVAYGMIGGAHHRIGGWGFPVSDEGSGAWLGLELVRRILWAEDGRIGWTGLLRGAFNRFRRDPHSIVRWMDTATPRDFAVFAPLIVHHAARGDPIGRELMRAAASHADALAARLAVLSIERIALCGGLAQALETWLAQETRNALVRPAKDALDGAILIARAEADGKSLAA